MSADKREIAPVFRDRLQVLLDRRSENATQFAARFGVDRSALSQFLDPALTRLPRAETLAAIAQAEGVSIDWLLGISQSEKGLGELDTLMGVEMAPEDIEDSKLAEWRREAMGYKIRYVPTSLPDMLKTNAVTQFEFGAGESLLTDAKKAQSQSQLDYSRLPESDMEVVMPVENLIALASGQGIWAGLTRGERIAQLEFMTTVLDELYPTFRLYLYEGRKFFSAPFTVFGQKRAAIYLGEMYLVVNSVSLIREFTRRFDQLIRVAHITADRTPQFISTLKVP